MRYKPIHPKLFQDRRAAFTKKMRQNTAAIFFSNDRMTRTGDQDFPYRQDSSFFTMTGIEQPESVLILHPGAKKKSNREILFILPQDPLHTIWNGERLSPQQASDISGIRQTMTSDQLKDIAPEISKDVRSIYISHPDTANHGPDGLEYVVKQLFRPDRKVSLISAHDIMKTIRMYKHPVEIDLLKHAIDVTGDAFRNVLKKTSPGKKEFEIEAEITYIFSASGCRHAFDPIVASGKSACVLHYITNDRTIKNGDLILLDFGAEYANMCADMTRTIPANGKFTKDQKKIYLSVMYVLKEVTQMMQPGITLEVLQKEAGKLIEGELVRLKVISKRDIRHQDKNSPLWKKYFMHGISHHLGYDVHDLSQRKAALAPGMVITCEPGMYLPAMGMGIRLENDIYITKKGPVNLMEGIPIDPDEIESLMHS